MANTIKLKRGSGSDPSASDLAVGELAVRTDSGKIFTKKDNGSVAEISGGGGISDGDKGDITVSGGGDTFTIDNGVITSAKIADGAIVNADINASAAIAGSKISPTFTSDLTVEHTGDPTIKIHDTSGDNQCRVHYETDSHNWVAGLHGGINTYKISKSNAFGTNDYLEIDGNGTVNVANNLDVGAGIDVTGASTFSSSITSSGSLILNQGVPEIQFNANSHENDFRIINYQGVFIVQDVDALNNRFTIASDGNTNFTGNVNCGAGLDVTGNITVSGTVDGRDIATDGTKLDGIESNATADQTASEILTLLSDQNISTTGTITSNDITISDQQPRINFTDTNGNPDYLIQVDGGHFLIHDATNGADKIKIQSDGHIDITPNTDFGAGIDVTGNITVSGTSDLSGKVDCQGGLETDGDVILNSSSTNVNITFDASDAALEFTDNAKATFGSSADLKLHHDGTDNYIESTGKLYIKSSNFVDIRSDGNETMIKATPNGSVELYHNNNKHLETATNGGIFRGTTWTAVDNCKFNFGTGDDLQIYHSGSDSFIVDQGTGDLIIQGSQTKIRNTSGHPQIVANNDVVELYYDNSKKFETNAEGVRIVGKLEMLDDERIQLGTGDDLQLYHDGSHSYVRDVGTGELRLASDSVVRITKGDSETMASFTVDGGCDFKFDNSSKLTTTSNGTTVAANADIRFTNGTWTGNSCKIQHHDNRLYIVGGTDGIIFREDGTNRWRIDGSGHYLPASDSTYNIGSSSVRVANGYFDTLYGDGSNLTNLPSSSDNTKLPLSGGELTGDLITHQVRPDGNGTRSLGTASYRWSDVFTSDLHLSNKARGANEFDNTWGDYTIQEGLNDLFLKNNRTGKKYKFNLTEIK